MLSATLQSENLRQVRTVAFASLIGTSIEWYDFFIYGTLTSIVFSRLFFPGSDALVSALLAYATFAVGFLVRPIGGIIIGHFGDRIGRKPLLIFTLSTMGVATFLIGLLPTYEQVGVAAPIALVTLRVMQGLALGGEWGGAVLMAFEFSNKETRARYSCYPQIGLAVGLALATGVVTILTAAMDDRTFLAWGWRVAFLLSVVLLGVGTFVRLKVMESPEFHRTKVDAKIAKTPLFDVIRQHKREIILGWGARLIDGNVFSIYAIFSIGFLATVANIPRTTVLFAITVAALALTVTIPLASIWADRVGRRKVYIWFSIICGVAAFPILATMQYSGNSIVASAALVVGLGIIYAPVYGPQPAIFCELFDTNVRYTGISIIYQIGAILSVSIAPIVATTLLAYGNNTPWAIASYMMIAGLISAACVSKMGKAF
jgi:MHS family shikimate/dehydroshikimate transporter-like MFS transporter